MAMTSSAALNNEEFRDLIINQFHEDIGPVNDVTRLAYEIYYSKLIGKKERRYSLRTRAQTSTTSQPGHRIIEDLSSRSTLNLLNASLRNAPDTATHSFTRRSSSLARPSSSQSRRYSGGIRRDVSSTNVVPVLSYSGVRGPHETLGESFSSYLESLSPAQVFIPGLIFLLIVLIWLST